MRANNNRNRVSRLKKLNGRRTRAKTHEEVTRKWYLSKCAKREKNEHSALCRGARMRTVDSERSE